MQVIVKHRDTVLVYGTEYTVLETSMPGQIPLYMIRNGAKYSWFKQEYFITVQENRAQKIDDILSL